MKVCVYRWVGLVSLIAVACDGAMVGQRGRPADAGAHDVGSGWPNAADMGTTKQPPPGSCVGCEAAQVGMGGIPFDPQNADSEFVSTDGEGALVVDRGASYANRYLWVADTDLPGVVKIDMQTLAIVGRYRTGGASTSRTTVNALGEAFIGARLNGTTGLAGVTKILPDGKNCPDRNNDGVVTTSSGPDDVLPYGQDECVVWHTETEGDIRGLAAQDIPGGSKITACEGFKVQQEFDPGSVSVPDQHYVWVGGIHGKVYKLDAATGAILMTVDAPVGVYGAALAGDGRLWIGAGAGGFGYIDTAKCTDAASCEATPVCDQVCTPSDCKATCDGAVRARYSGMLTGYGITVDRKQRVWRSAYPSAGILRYDPNAPVDQRLSQREDIPAHGGGVAADANGWVWAADIRGGLVRVDAETLDHVALPATTKGVAVDTAGRVFGVDYAGKVHVVAPGAAIGDYQLQKDAVTLPGVAYAYSDMSGVQARLASLTPGWYRKKFSPCPDKSKTEWVYLDYDVELPVGTWAMFNLRTADTPEDLANAPWYTVACISPPGGKGEVPIGAAKGRLVEAEVRMVGAADPANASTLRSARIKAFGTRYRCTGLVE